MSTLENNGEGYGRSWTEIAAEMEQHGSRSATERLLVDRLCAAEKPQDTIAAVLDEAAGRFRHCILFRVQQDVATVWGACGWMDQTRLLVQFSSSAVSGNPLELLQAHDDYRGDAPIEQAYVPFFQQLGLNYPAQISLRPVRVAGRRVGILYGDEGQDRPLRGTEAGDRELTGRLSLGLTLCLIKNKLRSP